MKAKFKKSIVAILASLAMITGCAGNEDDQGGGDEPPVVVEKKVESVTLNQKEVSIEAGSSATLIATVLPVDADNKALEWKSSNESVAIVSGTGKVTAVDVGDATITATAKDGSGKLDTCAVHVTAKDTTVHVESVELDNQNLALDLNVETKKSAGLNARVYPNNATDQEISFRIEQEGEIISYEGGVVTAKHTGTAKIIFTSHDGGHTATCNVTVSDSYLYAKSVAIAQPTYELNESTSIDVSAIVTYIDDTTDGRVTWTSSNPIIHVENGKIYAGKTSEDVNDIILTATSVAKPGLTATCKVNVKDVATSDEVHVASFDLAETLGIAYDGTNVGEGSKLIASNFLSEVSGVAPENTKINFSIESGEDVITLTADGDSSVIVKPKGNGVFGTATIKAVPENPLDASVQKLCTVTISDSIVHVTSIKLVDNAGAELTDVMGIASGTESLNFVVKGADDAVPPTSLALTFSSENPEAVYVEDSSHIIHYNSECDNVKITATSVQDPSVSMVFYATVRDPQRAQSIELTDNMFALRAGKTLNLANLVSIRNYKKELIADPSVTWEVTNPTPANVLTVSASGVVTTTQGVYGHAVVRVTSVNNPAVHADFDITVVDQETVVVSLNQPAFLTQYQSAVSNTDSVTDLPTTGATLNRGKFFDPKDAEEKIFKVGNLGGFTFNPTGNYSGGITAITKFEYTLGVKDDIADAEYTSVSDLSTYLSVEDKTNKISFTSAATNKYFKLSALPDHNLYKIGSACKPVELEFEVIDGYNVYNIYDLAAIDNINTYWDGLRPEGSENIYSVIFQKDVSINNDNIPDSLKWTKAEVDRWLRSTDHQTDFLAWAGILGYDTTGWEKGEGEAYNAFVDSPIDFACIYDIRTFGHDYRIEGNYFSLSAANCKQVAYLMGENGDTMVAGINGNGSHAQIININEEDGSHSSPERTGGDFVINNLKFTGNGDNLSEQKYKGGFIGIKADSVNLTVNNMISSKAFTTFLTENISRPECKFEFNRVKAYDSFNSAFYAFGSLKNTFNDCWFTSAGGPLFILDEPCNQAAGAHRQYGGVDAIPSVVANNCYLYNPVKGTEAWFVSHDPAPTLVQSYLVGAGDPQNEQGWIGQASYALNQQLQANKDLILGQYTAEREFAYNAFFAGKTFDEGAYAMVAYQVSEQIKAGIIATIGQGTWDAMSPEQQQGAIQQQLENQVKAAIIAQIGQEYWDAMTPEEQQQAIKEGIIAFYKSQVEANRSDLELLKLLGDVCAATNKLTEEADNKSITNMADRTINFIAIDVCSSSFDSNVVPLGGSFIINNTGKENGFTAGLDLTHVQKNETAGTKILPDQVCAIIIESVGGVGAITANLEPYFGTDSINQLKNLFYTMTSDYISYYLDPVLAMAHSPSGSFLGVLLGTTSL